MTTIRPTVKQIQNAVHSACNKFSWLKLSENPTDIFAKSGKDADQHLNTNGSYGYFSLEDYGVSDIYYEFPNHFWELIDAITDVINQNRPKHSQLYIEMHSPVEFSIWE